jgi:hypothetical protein
MPTSMHWVHPEKRRYYQAFVLEDLLGDWEVVSAWGTLDSKHGGSRGSKRKVVGSREAAEAVMAEIGKRRRQRGYQSVQSISALQSPVLSAGIGRVR